MNNNFNNTRPISINERGSQAWNICIIASLLVLLSAVCDEFLYSQGISSNQIDSTACLQLFNKLRTNVQEKRLEPIYYEIFAPNVRQRSKEFFGSDPIYYFTYADSVQLKGLSYVGKNVRLDIVWYLSGKSVENPMYVVRDGDGVFLTLPIYALTQDWERKEIGHFVFVFKKNSTGGKYGIPIPTSYAVNLLEKHYSTLANMLDVDLGGKVEIFIVGSPEEAGHVMGANETFEAVCEPKLGIIVSTFPWSVFHELAHLFEYRLTRREVLGFAKPIVHGFAEYMDGSGGMRKGKLSTEWMKEEIKGGKFKSIKDIDTDPEFPYATALVEFLAEEYGYKKFRELLLRSVDNEAFRNACAELYQKSLDDLEQEWKSWIINRRIPNERHYIEFDIITHDWERKNTQTITVLCDTKQKMPTLQDILQAEKQLSESRTPAVSHEPLTFFLVNNVDRMRELFGVREPTFQRGNILAATKFDLSLFRKKD
ncbi:MAG: hypothetical protein ONB05_00900 [candidate division KSB1 bacterium]|nr:hypothetical protein [candidate division KSB1 bacterium]